MSAIKASQGLVYGIGAFAAVALGAGMYFLMLKPLYEANTKSKTDLAGIKATTASIDGKSFTIETAPAAQEQLTKTKQRVAQSKADLAVYERRYQLPKGQDIYLGKTREALIRDAQPRWFKLPKNVVLLMRNFANKLAKKHNLEIQTGFSAPGMSSDVETIPKDIIAWPLGGMIVQGSFDNVMRWVNDWKSAPLLASVDGPKLQIGLQSGDVIATCSLIAYVFPTGPGAKLVAGNG